MKINQTKLDKIANDVCRRALQVFNYDVEALADGDPEYISAVEHAFEDYHAQLLVASLLLAGKYKKACREAWDLDTATRDMLPTSMWKLLDKHNDM